MYHEVKKKKKQYFSTLSHIMWIWLEKKGIKRKKNYNREVNTEMMSNGEQPRQTMYMFIGHELVWYFLDFVVGKKDKLM